MDRDLERDGRDQAAQRGRERQVDRQPEHERPDLSREREVVRDRNRVWRISPAERQTLFEIGRFRTLAGEDLLAHRYGGNARDMRDDLRSLSAQGLLQRRSARIQNGKKVLDVVVLTKAAKRLVEGHVDASGQAIYAGFVKPSEVAHDAAIYRMYHAESERIRREGGTPRRVVLDYELKRQTYAPLAKSRHLPRAEFVQHQADVAREFGLTVVNGRLVLPDLRIEFLSRDGSLARVDLELATEHYHGSHLAPKAQAGFTFYAADRSAGRLTRVMEEREITATILSL